MANDDETSPPPAVITRAVTSGYLAALLAAGYAALSLPNVPADSRVLALAIGGGLAALIALAVYFVGRGSARARTVFLVLWVLYVPFPLVRWGLPAFGSPLEAVLGVTGLLEMGLLTLTLALLYTGDSPRWFGDAEFERLAREAEAERRMKARAAHELGARIAEPGAVAAAHGLTGASQAPRSAAHGAGPVCATCRRTLNALDLAQGATVVMGGAPLLYQGVVCASCGMVQCASCKGSPQNAPCRRCGSAVRPAYQHYL